MSKIACAFSLAVHVPTHVHSLGSEDIAKILPIYCQNLIKILPIFDLYMTYI